MRPRWDAVVVWVVMLVLTARNQKGSEAAPMDEPVAINFSRDVGWSGSEGLELIRDGSSTLDLSFNYDGRPEIGTWQAVLPPKHFDATWALLRVSGYKTLPGPSSVAPGTKLLSIGVRGREDQVPWMRGFWMKPPPPELVPTVAALDAAMAELRKHPLRVLRGQASLGSPRVKKGQRAALTVRLTNVGSQMLTISNPLVGDPGSPGDWSGLRLTFADPHGKESDENLDVSTADVRAMPSTREPTLHLAPGASLDLEIRQNLDVPSGTYQLRVEYHNMIGDSSDSSVVRGTLGLDAGRVKIDPWWKLWG
jgi:hypothetical protein